MFILFALSYTYAALGDIGWVSALFEGLKAAVMAIVVAAVIKIGKKALKNSVMFLLAAGSFIAIFFLKVPFPWIVLGAGLVGLAGSAMLPNFFWSSQKRTVLILKAAMFRSVKMMMPAI